MYNPISLNVIRQALEWHGFAPQTIKRQFQQKWPNGNITTIYTLSFPAINLQRATGWRYGLTCDQDLQQHVSILNGCFCDDCHIVASHYDPASDTVTVELYTYFERKESEKPRWKQ